MGDAGSGRRRKWWGWGYEGEGLSDDEVGRLAQMLGPRFGVDASRRTPPDPADLGLPPPRVRPHRALAGIAADDPASRASHAYGCSYRDVVRALRGEMPHPPDLVLAPRSEAEVASVLDWCTEERLAAIPYGGGTSVVGGVEPDVGDGFAGCVSVDLGALSQVREVDALSLAARIEAGALGPSLEADLRPRGLTLRHFPQSFECSTLGGWIATRAGGHFATGPTHIDDLVEGLRVVTPAGLVETRRLPGSGAGPSPDRLFIGSEGALGIVTEAWVRVRRRPRWRAGGAARFATFELGAEGLRALAQSGLMPANCRLVDPVEALVNGAGDGSSALLIVGFESAEHPLDAWAEIAAECVRDHAGVIDEGSWGARDDGQGSTIGASPGRAPGAQGSSGSAAPEAWRSSFIRAPYMRDALVTLGMFCDTFETAVTWDRFSELHSAVVKAAGAALAATGASTGFVTCRITHVYPDGPAPYFTVMAPASSGAELEQWGTLKAAISDAMLAAGGTITHHHAVGRDHRTWYDRQRPDLFAEALRGAKEALDPAGICNPGVLIDPLSL
ncbi:MAG: FAD-binding oxidoreductase [Actinomycetota bacterium]|nr:FAD-binding oxidoreductase [Actinomycetota bacterium]